MAHSLEVLDVAQFDLLQQVRTSTTKGAPRACCVV